MNWDKMKNSLNKEQPSSFYDITDMEYFNKWTDCVERKWITKISNITDTGYSVYTTTVNALGKENVLGGPKIKSTGASVPVDLTYFNIVKYDNYKRKYVLDFQGPGIIEVLIRCIRGDGEPKF